MWATCVPSMKNAMRSAHMVTVARLLCGIYETEAGHILQSKHVKMAGRGSYTGQKRGETKLHWGEMKQGKENI